MLQTQTPNSDFARFNWNTRNSKTALTSLARVAMVLFVDFILGILFSPSKQKIKFKFGFPVLSHNFNYHSICLAPCVGSRSIRIGQLKACRLGGKYAIQICWYFRIVWSPLLTLHNCDGLLAGFLVACTFAIISCISKAPAPFQIEFHWAGICENLHIHEH